MEVEGDQGKNCKWHTFLVRDFCAFLFPEQSQFQLNNRKQMRQSFLGHGTAVQICKKAAIVDTCILII